MTTNEAIKILTNIEAYLIAGNPIWDTDTIREAFDMAIEELEDCDGVADALNGYAELYRKLKEKYDNLKEKHTGHWTKRTTVTSNVNTFYSYECSECGDHHGTMWKYCPHCGARMEGEEE